MTVYESIDNAHKAGRLFIRLDDNGHVANMCSLWRMKNRTSAISGRFRGSRIVVFLDNLVNHDKKMKPTKEK